MSATSRAYLALSLAMILAGSSVVAGKYMVESFPVFMASSLRVGLAALMLVGLVLVRERRIQTLPFRTHLVLVLQALTGIAIFNAFMLAGLERTSAATSGIITSATPVLVLVVSALFGERLNRQTMIAVLIATSGLVVLNLGGGEDGSLTRRELTGGLLVLAAVIGEAFYTILGKVATTHLKALSQAMWIAIYGFLMLLPLAVFEIPDFAIEETRQSGWIAILYSALLVTVLSAVLWFWGLGYVSSGNAGIFTGILPISAVVLAAILLDESIRWPHLVGIACILTAIAMIIFRSRKSTADLITAPVPG